VFHIAVSTARAVAIAAPARGMPVSLNREADCSQFKAYYPLRIDGGLFGHRTLPWSFQRLRLNHNCGYPEFGLRNDVHGIGNLEQMTLRGWLDFLCCRFFGFRNAAGYLIEFERARSRPICHARFLTNTI